MVLCDLITRADDEVILATPYFVPSLPVRLALQSSLKRGVKLKIILPNKSDQWLVDRASMIFAEQLQRQGATLYIQSECFLHAKILICDQKTALLGSANMDERSFRLNWELSILIAGTLGVAQTRRSLDRIIGGSRILALPQNPKRMDKRIAEGFVRILTPIL
jgi:cardiolipin synthase